MPLSFLYVGKKSEYQIGFTGLSDGLHEYTFTIGKAFFEQFDYTEIENANMRVRMVLEKKPTMLVVSFEISGEVNVMCDRCTDYFDLPVSGESGLIYKFGDQDLDDENVITVYPGETDIHVAQPIYEAIILLLPVRKVHPEGMCNQEMLNDIDKYLMVEESSVDNTTSEIKTEEETDPRWAALKKLKNNNKNNK